MGFHLFWEFLCPPIQVSLQGVSRSFELLSKCLLLTQWVQTFAVAQFLGIYKAQPEVKQNVVPLVCLCYNAVKRHGASLCPSSPGPEMTTGRFRVSVQSESPVPRTVPGLCWEGGATRFLLVAEPRASCWMGMGAGPCGGGRMDCLCLIFSWFALQGKQRTGTLSVAADPIAERLACECTVVKGAFKFIF